ncbi:Hypothetical_protein [Hexamita inflata]|uniref:Hypothetical_protein n=1 Tax=Hexamita inflata TaxID=28002 RepID=A0AA86QSG8_9EUKA|nr:Hypothetical protein HINF_LOCUS52834 [Hexamita inflata]
MDLIRFNKEALSVMKRLSRPYYEGQHLQAYCGFLQTADEISEQMKLITTVKDYKIAYAQGMVIIGVRCEEDFIRETMKKINLAMKPIFIETRPMKANMNYQTFLTLQQPDLSNVQLESTLPTNVVTFTSLTNFQSADNVQQTYPPGCVLRVNRNTRDVDKIENTLLQLDFIQNIRSLLKTENVAFFCIFCLPLDVPDDLVIQIGAERQPFDSVPLLFTYQEIESALQMQKSKFWRLNVQCLLNFDDVAELRRRLGPISTKTINGFTSIRAEGKRNWKGLGFDLKCRVWEDKIPKHISWADAWALADLDDSESNQILNQELIELIRKQNALAIQNFGLDNQNIIFMSIISEQVSEYLKLPVEIAFARVENKVIVKTQRVFVTHLNYHGCDKLKIQPGSRVVASSSEDIPGLFTDMVIQDTHLIITNTEDIRMLLGLCGLGQISNLCLNFDDIVSAGQMESADLKCDFHYLNQEECALEQVNLMLRKCGLTL